jgi:tripartite-type tricarboxylate transporter receptor subunit TctC
MFERLYHNLLLPQKSACRTRQVLRAKLFSAGVNQRLRRATKAHTGVSMLKTNWAVFALVLCVILCLSMPQADAQQNAKEAYPNRPIRFLVPFTVGGGADIAARTMAQTLGDELGQQIVVDNRPGSGGVLGMEMATTSSANGYTLVMGNISTIAVAPAVYRRLPYDPIRDLSPITLIASSPYVMSVTASMAPKTVQEFVALAKSRPGKLNYASTGIASPGHLTAALLSVSSGIQMEHVPYKDISQIFVDMYSGQIQLYFSGISPALTQMKSGKIRLLAVTSAKRSPQLAELPTVAETGVPGFEVTGWYGLFAPGGTPPKIVGQINAAVKKIAAGRDLPKRFAAIGADLTTNTPEEFAAFVKSEITKWAKVVKDSGMRID